MCSPLLWYIIEFHIHVYAGYNDVIVIPSDARHVTVRDDGTSGNDMFIGMHLRTV